MNVKCCGCIEEREMGLAEEMVDSLWIYGDGNEGRLEEMQRY